MHISSVALALVVVGVLLFSSAALGQQQDDRGQLQARIEALEARVRLLQYKSEVAELQFEYNRNFDKLVTVGSVRNHTDALFQSLLQNITNAFCPAPHFKGWLSWFGGSKFADFTDVASISSTYDFLAGGVFLNISRHFVTNVDVTPYIDAVDGLQRAYLVANIGQWDIFKLAPQGPVWTSNFGYYRNTYLLLNGNWCLEKFEAHASSLHTYVGATVTEQDLNPDRH